MERIALYNDSMQNWKKYELPKAQLVLADLPYQLGVNAFASNPSWYKGGDNKNGKSKKAHASFFDTDTKAGFRIPEFFHFCNGLLKKEPKETNSAGCLFFFCAYEQQGELIAEAKKYGFPNVIPMVFIKIIRLKSLKQICVLSGTVNMRCCFTVTNCRSSEIKAGWFLTASRGLMTVKIYQRYTLIRSR